MSQVGRGGGGKWWNVIFVFLFGGRGAWNLKTGMGPYIALKPNNVTLHISKYWFTDIRVVQKKTKCGILIS